MKTVVNLGINRLGELKTEIFELQQRLNQYSSHVLTFSDPVILEVSQMLDQKILEYMRIQKVNKEG